MSVYGSVYTPPEFEDGWEAEPYIDVAHDNGGYDKPGGSVRLIAGFDIDHSAHVFLTPPQARALAWMLLAAADRATPD